MHGNEEPADVREYQGENLNHVAFPLGGIGTFMRGRWPPAHCCRG
jgi:hypothetical protein